MSEQGSERRNRRDWTIAAGALVALAIAAIAIFGFFFHRDNFSTHYPIKVISAQTFLAGELPWWNFYDGGGQPLAGNPNTLTFYPDNFLYLLFPAHVAFNLHFLLHLLIGWLAMRVLSRSAFAAWVYVLSGMAISCLSFYNLITAIALIPLALLAVERSSVAGLGLSFGLLALAGEPVTLVATAIACAIAGFDRMRLRMAWSVPLALLIASPLVLAWSEISSEVERGAHRYSAATVLNASLDPRRFLEMITGPIVPSAGPHLFPTLFIGFIVLPALLRRSRYTVIVAVMAFFALGSWNPIVRAAVSSFDWLRIGRFPEKFALPMCVALVVLIGQFVRQSRAPRIWALVTFLPLIFVATTTLPIDWFSPYRVRPGPTVRVAQAPLPGGQEVSRSDYRLRAERLDPLFGAVANVRYAGDRSPDGMFSLMSRIAAERAATTHNPRWLQIAGCSNVPGALPRAMIVTRAQGTASVADAVRRIEDPRFDFRAEAVAPMRLDGFVSPAMATVEKIVESPQALHITVSTPAPALLFVNETFFRAWVARAGSQELQTVPLDLDRLGVMVPAGRTTVSLRFGRRRTAVVAAWVLSSLCILALLFWIRVQKRDGSAGQIERASHEDAASVVPQSQPHGPIGVGLLDHRDSHLTSHPR